MLDEPVIALASPSPAPATMSRLASVTMNDGSLVLTTISPLSRPTIRPMPTAISTPIQGDSV